CGPAYRHPPSWDVTGRVGRKAARRAFEMAGIGPEDVDVCELYDPFSFEVIRQLEAFGFCGEGEGGAYVTSGVIEPSGRHPVCTDGGLLAHSHTGTSQLLQKVVQASRQLRGDAVNQVQGARVALCSNGGAGALFTHVLILGRDRP
ncbi:MAG TPA: thiolase family protein, partial [Dehalococcoidia bacterium]